MRFHWITAYVVLVTLALRHEHVSADLNDTHGNAVYDNGTVTWVPIPVGNAVYITKNYYDDGGLGTLFGFSRSFINTVQPNDFPYDVLSSALNGTFDIGKDYMKLVNYSMGFAVCFAIGLLFVIFLPICGCCICCCRCCCGNCGGDMKAIYNKNEDCKRMGLAQALFMMVVLMSASSICIWMTNGRFTVALNYADETVATNFDDLQTYFNNLAAQFKYLAIDMYNLIQRAVVTDIGSIGTVMRDAIFSNLGITDVVTAVIELDTAIHNISDALAQVISDTNTLINASDTLSNNMNTLGTSIDATKSICISSGTACQTACDTFDTTALKSGSTDFSSLPDLTSVQTQVDNIKASNLTAIALAAQDGINNVSATIDASAASAQNSANSTMNSFASTVETMADDLITRLNGTIDTSSFKGDLRDFFQMLLKYDGYRLYFGYALTGLFTFIVVMCMIGICCGCLGQDSDKLPTERGFLSNWGGKIMILPVIFMFILGSLLMLLTTLTFVIGGNMEKICQPMIDLTIFRDFIDTGGVGGLNLGELIHKNASSSIGIYTFLLSVIGIWFLNSFPARQILDCLKLKPSADNFRSDTTSFDHLIRGCRANKAPFKLLQLDQLLPIESTLNHTQYTSSLTSDLSSLTSVDLTSYSILTPDMKTQLENIQNSGLNNIDFAAINSTLGQSVTGVDFSALILAMETIRDSCSGTPYTNWNLHIAATRSIENNDLPAVTAAQTNLQQSMAVLEGLLNGLDAKVNNTITTAEHADNQLQNNVTATMDQAINDFVNRLINYVEQYKTEALDVVYNEIGRCLPVWNIYDSFTSILCRYMVETLNAFWFATGWGLLFFIPVMVASCKLSKYYRTMKTQEGYKEEEEPIDEDMDDFEIRYDAMQRNNKVAPDPDYYD